MKNEIKFHSTARFEVIHWAENMKKAFTMMEELSVRHLPVVDDNSSIVGMLSDRDVKRAMKVELLSYVSGKTPDPKFDLDSVVRDYMSWPVETISDDQTVADAAKSMIDKKMSSLVVTQGSLAVAIITSEDLLKVLLEKPQNSLQALKDNIASALYNSPVSSIAQSLSNAGI